MNGITSTGDHSPSLFTDTKLNAAAMGTAAILNPFDGFEFRNSEEVHNVRLAIAQAHHDAVREHSGRLLRLEALKEEAKDIHNIRNMTEEQLRVETLKANEACRLRDLENKRRNLPKPALLKPDLPSQPASTASIVSTQIAPTHDSTRVLSQEFAPASRQDAIPTAGNNSVSASPASIQAPLIRASVTNCQPAELLPSANLLSSHTQNHSAEKLPTVNHSTSLFANATLKTSIPSAPHKTVATGSNFSLASNQYLKDHAPSHNFANTARYREIHDQMKAVRKYIDGLTGPDGKSSALKKRCGSGRREITKALGQLVVETPNTSIQQRVIETLRIALQDNTQSIEAARFTVTTHSPVKNPEVLPDGCDRNGDRLSITFIYLMAAFCKAVCAQLVSEAAVKPLAAGPIGILVAKVFSDPTLQWRGKTFIDMLIAKIFVACPIIFGVRGDEKTHQGRTRIGWRKVNGNFISEQAHYDRMAGIAAGFASISLRDFSRSKARNPYPPINYWLALSTIVSTPAEESCPSQFVVLKGLVQNFFQRFIEFYGDMAVAALQAALVEFPKRGDSNHSAIITLKTLGATLRKDHGLNLF